MSTQQKRVRGVGIIQEQERKRLEIWEREGCRDECSLLVMGEVKDGYSEETERRESKYYDVA
jgi:hypothetical protein